MPQALNLQFFDENGNTVGRFKRTGKHNYIVIKPTAGGYEIFYDADWELPVMAYIGKEPDLHAAKLAAYNHVRKHWRGVKKHAGPEPWKYNRDAIAERKRQREARTNG